MLHTGFLVPIHLKRGHYEVRCPAVRWIINVRKMMGEIWKFMVSHITIQLKQPVILRWFGGEGFIKNGEEVFCKLRDDYDVNPYSGLGLPFIHLYIVL